MTKEEQAAASAARAAEARLASEKARELEMKAAEQDLTDLEVDDDSRSRSVRCLAYHVLERSAHGTVLGMALAMVLGCSTVSKM